MTKEPNIPILITRITWLLKHHFKTLKCDYGARRKNRFVSHSHLLPLNFGNWWHIMPVVRVPVKGARELLLETADIRPLRWCKTIISQSNVLTIDFQNPLQVIMLILMSVGHRIWLQRSKWLAWKVWCQALLFWHTRIHNTRHWSLRWTRSCRKNVKYPAQISCFNTHQCFYPDAHLIHTC